MSITEKLKFKMFDFEMNKKKVSLTEKLWPQRMNNNFSNEILLKFVNEQTDDLHFQLRHCFPFPNNDNNGNKSFYEKLFTTKFRS